MRGEAVLLLLLGVALLPVAAAQVPEPVVVLTDPVDDLQFGLAGGAGSAIPGQRYPALDILEVRVLEQAETMLMEMALADLQPAQEVFLADDGQYTVQFDHNDQTYLVQINRVRADQYYAWGALFKAAENGASFNFVRQIDVEHDTAANTLRWMLLREDLLDLSGAAPFPGRALDQFVAWSHLRSAEGWGTVNGNPIATPYDAWDMAPDGGDPDGSVPIMLGLAQSGHAALFAPAPMRASNGEATTFVYTLTARNTGEAEDLFAINTRGAPANWRVVVPDNLITLDGGASLDIPILVTTPFTHQHGAVQTMQVELESQSDPGSVGRAELGVRYHAIPQPAGHHDTVWFHSQRFGEDTPLFVVTENLFAGNSGVAFLNTLETDADDQGVPIKGNFNGYSMQALGDELRTRWSWAMFLQPGLEMGLDFNLDGTGHLSLPFESSAPLVQAVASGELIHFAYDERAERWEQTQVASLVPSDPIDLNPNQEQRFDWEFKVNDEADRLEYARRAAFAVQVNLTSLRPSGLTGAEAPALMPGGVMTLPLFEYQDPIDEAFASIGQVMFHALGPQQKQGNPDEVRLLSAQLVNHRDVASEFRLTVEGVNADWAEILGNPTVQLPAGGEGDVTLAITVPSTAIDGDRADLVLAAEAVDDPTIRTLLRLVVVADTTADHPDESATIASLRSEAVEAAAPGTIALAALVGLAARRRLSA